MACKSSSNVYNFLLAGWYFVLGCAENRPIIHCVLIMAFKEVGLLLFFCFLHLGGATYCTSYSDCESLETCCSDNVCRQKCYLCSYDYECGTGECCKSSKCKRKCSDGGCREYCSFCSYSYQCDTGECCHSSDCKKKCFDGGCRKNCLSCSYNSDCDSGECCDSDDTCKSVCSHSLTGAAIGGIVFGCLVLAAIVISILACCCCACCPYYRHRHHPGTVLVTQPMGARVTATTTQQTIQQPLPVGYNQPLPVGYNQPPPVRFNQPPTMGYNPPPGGFYQPVGDAPPPYVPPQASGVTAYPPLGAQGSAPYPPAQAVYQGSTGQPFKQ